MSQNRLNLHNTAGGGICFDSDALHKLAAVSLQSAVQIDSAPDLHQFLQFVLPLLRNWSGCEAVGIRLEQGDDYPYFESTGFDDDFLAVENTLCCYQNTTLVRDEKGQPFLACMCGNIIRGRFNPAKPFFTKFGSFYTNSTTALLASTTENDRMANTRNRCNTRGFESVALIPLKHEDKILGLLQFNDKSAGLFTKKSIEKLESVAQSLAAVIAPVYAASLQQKPAQRKSEQTLTKEHEQFIQSLRQAKKRIESWGDDLAAIESASCRNIPDAVMIEHLVELSCEHLAAIIADVKHIATGRASDDSRNLKNLLDLEKMVKLAVAVRMTIAVIEKTKSSFKSKELGQLRKNLQQILDAT